jgi:hypothetical protein
MAPRFLCVLLKLFCHLKLVWHDHLGIREKQSKMQNLSIFSSFTFFCHFRRKPKMKEWASSNLFTKKRYFYSQFC